MYEAQGFEYRFPDLKGDLMESVLVAVDEHDQPVAAVAAERLCQLYLLVETSLHPAAKLSIIRAFHHALKPIVESKGYNGANAFLPPAFAVFGKRLERSFGWIKSWPCWGIYF